MIEVKTVLAFGAHPDDVEIHCGGTLARYAANGIGVVIAVLTDGSKGHMSASSEKLASRRAKEQLQSAAVIGAEVELLGFEDAATLHQDLDAREKVIDMLRKYQPDVVITHPENDYHPDHYAAAKLMLDASYIAAAPLVKTNEPSLKSAPVVYSMDPIGGMGRVPEEYVDITSTYETKRKMLQQHQSQFDWLDENRGLSPIDMIRIQAEFRGLQCGVRYAEAFTRCQLLFENNHPCRMLP